MTLQQIQDKVNPILATLASAIDARQATYFVNNGEYWQGKWTHTAEPVDGADVGAEQVGRGDSTRWKTGKQKLYCHPCHARTIDLAHRMTKNIS